MQRKRTFSFGILSVHEKPEKDGSASRPLSDDRFVSARSALRRRRSRHDEDDSRELLASRPSAPHAEADGGCYSPASARAYENSFVSGTASVHAPQNFARCPEPLRPAPGTDHAARRGRSPRTNSLVGPGRADRGHFRSHRARMSRPWRESRRALKGERDLVSRSRRDGFGRKAGSCRTRRAVSNVSTERTSE